MELKVFRDTLSAAGSFCTVKSEIPIETEILLSDYLPQVYKIVKCFVKMIVLQKQLGAGKLTLDGYLRCIVYYQGEEQQGLCQTEQKLPFSKVLETPSFEYSSWSAAVGGETEYLNCRAVNPRRVEVRGAYAISASVFTQVQQEIISAVSDCGTEQKQAVLCGVKNVAVLDKLINADVEFTFGQPPAAVLDITGTAQVRDLKVISGKAVAKGEIEALCAYRTGTDTLESQKASIPFNQILDLEGLTEDSRCYCQIEPVGFAVTMGENGAPGQLTVSALVHLRAFRDYEINCVSDVFSTLYETQTALRALVIEKLFRTLDDTVTVQTGGPLPDENTEIAACFVSFGPPEVTAQQGKRTLHAHGTATAFGKNSLGEIESVERPVELLLPLGAAETADCGEEENEMHLECQLTVETVSCAVTDGALEVTVSVRVQGFVLCRASLPAIDGVEVGEELKPADPEVSLRIYYAHEGEEVFDIARRFHVSPGEMLRANALEEETLTAARRLLVPGVG